MKTFLLASVLLVSAAWADDRLRDVQGALKNEGFYYGTVDGKEGPETSAAIRRYQIRNGLKVTGATDDETLAALGLKAGATAKPPEPAPSGNPPADIKKPVPQVNPPRPGETPSESVRGHDLLRDNRPSDGSRIEERPRDGRPPADESDADRPARPRVYPGDPAVVPPPRPIPSPTRDEWDIFYHGTPYANAPVEVQVDVLRKAQELLARRRLYRAVPDGIPGPATNEALFRYQEQRQLSRTGRLDLATLSDLNLLPGRGPDAPPLKPFYNPNRRRDRSVDTPGYIR